MCVCVYVCVCAMCVGNCVHICDQAIAKQLDHFMYYTLNIILAPT